MQSFRDSAGRVYNVAVTVQTIRRVRQLTGEDLGAAYREGPAALSGLVSDPERLVNVLYAVCQPQAQALGVTDEQFGEAMAGDALEQATDALLRACVDFLPSREAREAAAAQLAKGKELAGRLAEAARDEAARFDVEGYVSGLLSKAEGAPSTASRERLSGRGRLGERPG